MSTPTVSRPATRLTRFAMASLWHRRLARTRLSLVQAQPRVSAELILHPVISKRLRAGESLADRADSMDGYHAA